MAVESQKNQCKHACFNEKFLLAILASGAIGASPLASVNSHLMPNKIVGDREDLSKLIKEKGLHFHTLSHAQYATMVLGISMNPSHTLSLFRSPSLALAGSLSLSHSLSLSLSLSHTHTHTHTHTLSLSLSLSLSHTHTHTHTLSLPPFLPVHGIAAEQLANNITDNVSPAALGGVHLLLSCVCACAFFHVVCLCARASRAVCSWRCEEY